MSNLRIAAIYWDTSSVGGIATGAKTFRIAARQAGDTLHVVRCARFSAKNIRTYDKPTFIRGGDTYIEIDAECSHHPRYAKETIEWLEKNYDVLLFLFPCPHPTKAYGNEPMFLPLYTDCALPKIMRISDAYWSTYAEWGQIALDNSDYAFVNQHAYRESLRGFGDAYERVEVVPKPFTPLPVPIESQDGQATPLLVWPNQWKAIKGTKKFIQGAPDVPAKIEQEYYSCGIEYYNLRSTAEWEMAIDIDHFKGYDGLGTAQYFGFVSMEHMAQVYSRAWYTADFQGHSAKYEAYKMGSYNNTTVEALYYGALPILHTQALKSVVPQHLFTTVENITTYPSLFTTDLADMSRDPLRRTQAREWVLDVHGAAAIYARIMDSIIV